MVMVTGRIMMFTLKIKIRMDMEEAGEQAEGEDVDLIEVVVIKIKVGETMIEEIMGMLRMLQTISIIAISRLK
jgi:hypothetical protein